MNDSRFAWGLKGCALAAAVLLSGAASADVISIVSDDGNSQHGLGSYTGTIEYTSAVFSGEGTLSVSLTNTSDPGNGGFITAFGFNIDSADSSASASLNSATHPMTGFADEGAGPFGTLDAGAGLDGSFLGGGSPAPGIDINETGTFEFAISASDAASFTAANFIGDEENVGFVVRFRGFDDGGSDMVPGNQVPTPGALALLGVAGIAAGRRRRR